LYSYRLDLVPREEIYYDRNLQQAVIALKQQYGFADSADIDHAFIARLLSASFTIAMPLLTGNG
jgi:hypothetical protein